MPFGTTVEVRGEDDEDHWEITVLDTIPDATAMVLDERRFNDPPEQGHQFFMVKVRAKYLGPDSTRFFSSYGLGAVGDGAVVYGTSSDDSCGVIPDDFDSFRELFTGGQTEGNECWQIASTDADSLVMILDPRFGDGERTWFSLSAGDNPQQTPQPTPTPTDADRVIPVDTPTVGPEPAPTPTPGSISTPAELVERVKDGVVRVEAGFFSSGSGFIFDVDETTAFVATNHHVIENADAVDVVVRNTQTYKALVLGWDADRDVAVLSICCSDDFLALPWGEASPGVGDSVVAVGYPRGGSRWQVTATTGEVSAMDALSRRFDFIPHTAPLNPGNSGGPLFSMPGAKVLGINKAGGTQNLSFYAVPFQAIEAQLAEWRSQLVVTRNQSFGGVVNADRSWLGAIGLLLLAAVGYVAWMTMWKGQP